MGADLKVASTKPTIIVVDDFLPNPDEVRAYALTQAFNAAPEYFKGKRSTTRLWSTEAKEAFELLIGRSIIKDDYETNGVFQICLPTDPIVYHTDLQTHAATIYLTPNAPPDSGLSLYRNRDNKARRPTGDMDAFFGGFYDPTKWELVDRIGNVYNRLVIWDGSLVHAASAYFGRGLGDGRLFQMFFFDAP